MPVFRSVVAVPSRALGDFLCNLKAGPAGGSRPAATRRPPGTRLTPYRRRYLTLQRMVSFAMGLEQQVDQWREFYLIYVLLLSLGMLVPTGRRPCPGSRSWSLPWSGSATRSPPGGECGGYVSRP